jgi:hypothetical protein
MMTDSEFLLITSTIIGLFLFTIVVLMNLCTADTAPGFDDSLCSVYSSYFSGMQVVLAFGVGSIAFCRLVMGMPLHDELYIDLVLLPSDKVSCLPTPVSTFRLTDCKFLLIIILSGLISLGGLVATYVLATAGLANTELTEVSGWFAMWAGLVLIILLAACTIDTAPRFDDSLCSSVYSGYFSGMQVVLVFIGLGIGFIAFCRVLEVLHLDLLSSLHQVD